uniref:Transmembrane protein 119-like n=1 Tax=Seriola lalandi dorsalis TaxID=1841481 RepID=A0A3B4YW81_SERLL
MDGSGDAELELLFPISFSTRAPVQITTATGPPTLTNTITTTMIRLKDFVLSRVVDFLQENLLIIIVVTSLLIVMVFIICCASAMSHKRKLEAYKPPPHPPRKYMADKTEGPDSKLPQEPAHALGSGGGERERRQVITSPGGQKGPGGGGGGKAERGTEAQRAVEAQGGGAAELQPQHQLQSTGLHLPSEKG